MRYGTGPPGCAVLERRRMGFTSHRLGAGSSCLVTAICGFLHAEDTLVCRLLGFSGEHAPRDGQPASRMSLNKVRCATIERPQPRRHFAFIDYTSGSKSSQGQLDLCTVTE